MTTYTITLSVSDGLAARLASLPQEKVNAISAELSEVLVDIIDNTFT